MAAKDDRPASGGHAGEVTRCLEELRGGDGDALDRLMPLLYSELRQAAHRQLRRERTEHTLGTTGLVHETYLRLLQQRQIKARDRDDLFAIASTTMRRVLVDYARTRRRVKRGAGEAPLPLDEVEPFLSVREAEEVLVLDDALDRLGRVDPRAAQVVEHRLFGGFTFEETAEMLEISTRTAQRAWAVATAWLRKEVLEEVTQAKR